MSLAGMLLAGTPSATGEEARAPRLELKPARYAAEIAAGDRDTFQLTIANRTSRSIDIDFQVVDLEAGRDGSFARAATETPERSARTWIQYPREDLELLPNESERVPIGIDVPSTARPGAYAVALVASQSFSAIAANDAEAIGSKVRARVNLGSTIVIAVPGQATSSARIVSTSAPRIVWGSDEPAFEATVENTGDTLLELEAATELSSFGMFATRTLKSDEQPTLPGGRRELTMDWTDRPWIGWFEPKLVAVGGSGTGVREEQTLPTVFVIPPWWMIALAIIAIVLPVTSERRRRRRIREYREARRAARYGDDFE